MAKSRRNFLKTAAAGAAAFVAKPGIEGAQQAEAPVAEARVFDRPGSDFIGTKIDDPFIDYATIAKGMGVRSEGPISDPKDLGPAIRRGIQVVMGGEPYLIDVVTQGR